MNVNKEKAIRYPDSRSGQVAALIYIGDMIEELIATIKDGQVHGAVKTGAPAAVATPAKKAAAIKEPVNEITTDPETEVEKGRSK